MNDYEDGTSFTGADISKLLVSNEVIAERRRQDALWGIQNHADGTALDEGDKEAAEFVKKQNERYVCEGCLEWRDILYEEVLEAFAESDPAKLRAELIQVAAVAQAWVECIDRRGGK